MKRTNSLKYKKAKVRRCKNENKRRKNRKFGGAKQTQLTIDGWRMRLFVKVLQQSPDAGRKKTLEREEREREERGKERKEKQDTKSGEVKETRKEKREIEGGGERTHNAKLSVKRASNKKVKKKRSRLGEERFRTEGLHADKCPPNAVN